MQNVSNKIGIFGEGEIKREPHSFFFLKGQEFKEQNLTEKTSREKGGFDLVLIIFFTILYV